ncbi:serine hydrolase [Paenibacillus sp. UMB4589-SE434]|uniref:serine hydrolase domain-containing protein n=1 Tax=Paenibacillus sp. UMB4589-SE434 TaxID=3046314 RepID=UPI00254F8F0F|nr:serine hydrolase [Paenibacillus sp. UMB4589-SE434]MDK8179859.1 serine hydrolase [Paenibacillus sp. UMB4589-SE434]
MTNILTGFVNRITAEQLQVLSVRMLTQGTLCAKWDLTADVRRLQHSVSKSFTSMAVGLAIEEGKLTLDTRLGEFLRAPSSPYMENDSPLHPCQLTLRDLLRMSSGHDVPPLRAEERAYLTEKDWVKYYLSQPLDRPAGEQFTYSSGDTFMISALVQAAVGESVQSYLTPRLFEPLGIQDVSWETSPLGITLGCAGLKISTEELGRFGQLLLQNGTWEGQQLVPAHWIQQASAKQIENKGSVDWSLGYGYQFWRCLHGAYRADGAHGQFCIILPDYEAVIAINSEEDRMQDILDAVWTEILPLL